MAGIPYIYMYSPFQQFLYDIIYLKISFIICLNYIYCSILRIYVFGCRKERGRVQIKILFVLKKDNVNWRIPI